MSKSLQRFWTYFKLGLVIGLGLLILVTVIVNRNYKTDVWLFVKFEQVNTLWLIVVTAVLSIVTFWAATRVRGILAAVKKVKAEKAEEEKQAKQRAIAAELNATERRIDEKLQKAVADGGKPVQGPGTGTGSGTPPAASGGGAGAG